MVIMKNWTWKQWTALGITAAVIIALIVLHLVQPAVTYAFAEVMTACGFGVGAVVGYLFKKQEK
jgi:hypothetical protein